MEFKEFGKSEQPVIILIHNGGFENWKWDKQIGTLENKYHIVVPVLNQETVSEKELMSEVEDITSYINKEYNGKVYAICGLSNSWKLTKAIIAKHGIDAYHTLVESRNTEAGKFILSMI